MALIPAVSDTRANSRLRIEPIPDCSLSVAACVLNPLDKTGSGKGLLDPNGGVNLAKSLI